MLASKDPLTQSSIAVHFLGTVTPQADLDRLGQIDRNPQIAANELQWCYIEAIRSTGIIELDIFSTVAVSEYPAFPKILISANSLGLEQGAAIRFIPYLNIMLIKQITQILLGIPSLFIRLLKRRRKHSIILIYSMQTPFMIIARFSRKFFHIPIVLIIPDLPQYMAFQSTNKGFRHFLKLIDIRLQRKMLHSIDGAIILAEAIATDFLPQGMPVITIDSIRDFKEWANLPPAPLPSQAIKSILYSGGLYEAYGVKRLLEAFLCIEDPNLELWFAGKGELESTIKEAMLKDHRIQLFGQLPVAELRSLQSQASLLVSVKPTNDPFTKYSFPSKITEYMLSGRPVACTRTPGLNSEYFNYIYPLSDESTEAMKTSILAIFQIPIETRMDRATKGKEFLQATRSPYARGKELMRFFSQILEAKS